MRNYSFPPISHINDVLPHIEGRDEFRVMQKDWYTVINYMVALEDTFPQVNVAGGSPRMRAERALQNSILRECRGLIFDTESGRLISRPYHKFFNVGERPETHFNQLDLNEPHVILEKLDGSMIRPIPFGANGEFRLGTKAGVTDVAMNAEVWVAQRPHYIAFIRKSLEHGFTPIFEWCSRKNRIVVDYPTDRLVLTAMRHNDFGYYLPYKAMVRVYAEGYGIDYVKAIDSTIDNIYELVDTIRAWETNEGVVIRFEQNDRPVRNDASGHMFKIKADNYLVLHRSKDALSNEKNVIRIVVNDQLDDLIPILTEDDAQNLRRFQTAFWNGVESVGNLLVDTYLAEGTAYEEQRDFALKFVSEQPKYFHPFMYGLRKGRDIKEMLIEHISRSVSSQGKIDSARWMWGNLIWNV